jgi:asparagine synthase (glutamine-hydrolysing)
MVGLAIAICWDGDPVARELVGRMLDRVPYRGTARQVNCSAPGVCVGTVQDAHTSGSLTSSATIVCAADARLDNREEKLLPNQDELPNASQLLQRGYERWGANLAQHVIGDFALGIWDEARRCLYAARDAFGARTLFYHAGPTGILLASEVEQILASGLLQPELEDRVLLEYLCREHRALDLTFFRGVQRVPPGHWLLADRTTCRLQRYWLPPRHELRDGDHAERFRHLFRTAVADRLEADRPLVAQLSGGLDSASVVCMAEEIARSGQSVQLHLTSDVYPGLPCDETPLIGAVTDQVRFPAQRWDGLNLASADWPGGWTAHPWGGPGTRGREGDLHLAREVGAVGILVGFGGDELLFERGVFRDLAAQGRWLTLLTETVLAPGLYSSQSAAFFLWDALRVAAPPALRRFYRRLRPRPPEESPSWLGERLHGLWQESMAEDRTPPIAGSFTRRHLWNWLTRPALWWSIEFQALRAARHGLDLRLPFLDRRLADFVLVVPFEARLPRGRMKRLLRDAMRGVLPKAIAERRRVTTFDCLARRGLEHDRERFQDLLFGVEWLSAPFVDQVEARELIRALTEPAAEGLHYPQLTLARDIVQLEAWLRALRDQRPFSRRPSSGSLASSGASAVS